MSFSRLETWVLSRLPSRRTGGSTRLEANDEGLVFREGNRSILIGWQDVARVVALRRDTYVGNTVSLLFETRDGKIFELSEENPAWPQIGSTLSGHLTGTMSRTDWTVALVASEDGKVEIYPG